MKKIFLSLLFFAIALLAAWQAYKVPTMRDFVADILPHNIKHKIKNTIFIVPSLKEQLQLKNQEVQAMQAQLQKSQQHKDTLIQNTYFANFQNQVSKSWPYLATLLSQTQLSFHIEASSEILQSATGEEYQIRKFNLPFLPTALQHGYKPLFYLDSSEHTVFLTTGDGVFFYTSAQSITQNAINLTSLPSNIRQLIPNRAIYEPSWFSIKDIKIAQGKIYLSYNKKTGDNYTLGIAVAKLNLERLNFSEFFSIQDAVSPTDKKFNAHQLGGRIELLDDEHLIISAGDMSKWDRAQDNSSLLGKIFKINIHTKSTQILSKGHRNPQGLFYDKENNSIISTEHGPNGGDEFNIHKLDSNNVANFGWPIASYGLHYDSRFHEEAPLHKSHAEHGFIEPIKNYTPSVGISQVIKAPKDFKPGFKNDYFVTTMGLNHRVAIQSIHHFTLDDTLSHTKKHAIIKVGERIRDIVILDKQHILLALEGNNTPAIAILTPD